jgi:hypothetical protein
VCCLHACAARNTPSEESKGIKKLPFSTVLPHSHLVVHSVFRS